MAADACCGSCGETRTVHQENGRNHLGAMKEAPPGVPLVAVLRAAVQHVVAVPNALVQRGAGIRAGLLGLQAVPGTVVRSPR